MHEEEILDEDEEDDVMQQLPSVGEFLDIQYIIQHPSVSVSFHLFQSLFTNDTLNVSTLLQIRQSHNAFSRNSKSNSNYLRQTTIDINNDKISGNAVNKLITEMTADNIDENQRRRRRERWEGRKRLETLPNNTLGKIFHFTF